ncbi:unnamed protein product, partial [Scytosiphon promiscuus]
AAFPDKGGKAGATAGALASSRVSTQGKGSGGAGAVGSARQTVTTRPGPSSCPSVSSDGAMSRDGGGGTGRKLETGCESAGEKSAGGGGSASGVDGGGGGGRKGSMVNVDRDLQSKINAFTNTQKDLCKLEIMRMDNKFEWYEVRSSMRLAWLMTKQMIIPVEVICSFQQMHRDSPAGNANSIVARLQKAAAIARRPGTASDGKGNGDYLSGNSSGFSGFSGSGGSGDSNDAGSPEENSNDAGSPGPEDNHNNAATTSNNNNPNNPNNDSDGGHCRDPSSEDGEASEALSSDYGGGTSSGSVSGDGNSAHNNNDSRGTKLSNKKAQR